MGKGHSIFISLTNRECSTLKVFVYCTPTQGGFNFHNDNDNNLQRVDSYKQRCYSFLAQKWLDFGLILVNSWMAAAQLFLVFISPSLACGCWPSGTVLRRWSQDQQQKPTSHSWNTHNLTVFYNVSDCLELKWWPWGGGVGRGGLWVRVARIIFGRKQLVTDKDYIILRRLQYCIWETF